MNFSYHLPVNLIFGRKRIEEIGVQTAGYGQKAMVVTGKSSTKETGLLAKTIELLTRAGVDSVVFDRVEANPLTTTVYEGAELVKRRGCDVVVGLGGGSIVDAAKSIAFCALNDGDISEYIFGRKQGDRALPIIAVPTTAGTGSEGNSFSVLTNPDTKDKKSLRTPVILPKVSIIDPELMTTMPRAVIAAVGFDALTHNIEAYLALNSQPLTDIQAIYGVRLMAENLTKVYKNPDDMDAWEKVTLVSTLGGMVINTAGVTAPHGMEHPVSGLYNVVHGKGLAALMPVIIENSWESSRERLGEISRLLGGNDASDCAAAIRNFLTQIELKVTLGELGVKPDDVDWLAENCMKVSAPSMKNYPRLFSMDEIKEIYKKAL